MNEDTAGRKEALYRQLLKALAREKRLLESGRTEELELIGRKKQRIMSAVEALGSVPLPDPAGLHTALLEALRKAQAENLQLLQQRMLASIAELNSAGQNNKLRAAYRQAARHGPVFLDNTR